LQHKIHKLIILNFFLHALVTVVLKAGFQVLFCIRLRHPDSAIALGLFAMMAPLWAALLFTIGALFVQLVHQHIELGSVLEE
jgi:hypothetical protein